MASPMRTPLSRVRGLGSAKSGTHDFWRQRITALAMVPLVIIFLIVVISCAGKPHAEVVGTLSNPFIALLSILMIVAGTWHMKIGMQIVLEDYLHGELTKMLALIANNFFAILVGAAATLALLKISFGG